MTTTAHGHREDGDVTIKNKTVVVSGASSGIGLATAVELARRGARIVMVCRDARRAIAAQDLIAAVGPRKRPPVFLADFQALGQVRMAAEQIANEFETIDVIVNNAGSIFAKRELTADGFEKTFAVNHLAPFLLTNVLFESLTRAPAARVVVVTSETYSKRLDFDNLQGEKKYNFFRAYQHSKLANILFTNELARLAHGTGLTANSVSPGPAVTRFGDDLTGIPSLMPKVMKKIPFLFRPPEQAAAGVIRLAAGADVDGLTGRFFLRLDEQELKPGARDAEAAEKLWALCAEFTGIQAVPKALVGAS